MHDIKMASVYPHFVWHIVVLYFCMGALECVNIEMYNDM